MPALFVAYLSLSPSLRVACYMEFCASCCVCCTRLLPVACSCVAQGAVLLSFVCVLKFGCKTKRHPPRPHTPPSPPPATSFLYFELTKNKRVYMLYACPVCLSWAWLSGPASIALTQFSTWDAKLRDLQITARRVVVVVIVVRQTDRQGDRQRVMIVFVLSSLAWSLSPCHLCDLPHSNTLIALIFVCEHLPDWDLTWSVPNSVFHFCGINCDWGIPLSDATFRFWVLYKRTGKFLSLFWLINPFQLEFKYNYYDSLKGSLLYRFLSDGYTIIFKYYFYLSILLGFVYY